MRPDPETIDRLERFVASLADLLDGEDVWFNMIGGSTQTTRFAHKTKVKVGELRWAIKALRRVDEEDNERLLDERIYRQAIQAGRAT